MSFKKNKRTSYYISSSINLEEDNEGNFYENDVELKIPDSEDSFTNVHFKDRIKEEVSKFINRSFDYVVVLAGAGSSVVADIDGIDKKYGKTVAMIAENIAKELGDFNSKDSIGDFIENSFQENADLSVSSGELFTMQELATMSNYQIPVKIGDAFNNQFNLEDFLSNLLTYEQFMRESQNEKDKFVKSKEKILDLIKENTNYSFDKEKMKHDTFLKILTSKVKKENQLSIVTTNYDTLFEEAAEELEITVIDGFSFSYDPYFDSDMFDWKLVKHVPNVKTTQLEYKENVINLLKIHGSLTWERSESEKKIRRKHKSSVSKPIMVFPSSNKYAQSYDEPYFELFTKFQELLRKPNTLLITTGFSFADNHITTMITQAIKHNTGLNVLVSDFDIVQDHNNWKTIDELRKNHFQIAFLRATLNNDLIDYVGGQDDYR
ncbi:SIR2 family protein [Oceanobacillus oncorhynchi]|uniref:SIR2 family protein n=1 Tax=Oceanobacillus oncorhynchi TaxID=545501 RepID=UPI0018693A15|nr:SIR2 family protein [Oceanobacillus oncorhynchi]